MIKSDHKTAGLDPPALSVPRRVERGVELDHRLGASMEARKAFGIRDGAKPKVGHQSTNLR